MRLLTIKEVSATLAVSDSMVRKLIKGRKILAVKVGVTVRIPEDSLVAYLHDIGVPKSHLADDSG